eukprot:CAMPEP_0172539790 /NCGR_PEP_ID=MMETSP1067-20121228/10923_1 /TAXON_ID=265564 ORGANISM="Thalassiosira punctigera, Strain Tpunct2005C2" /NCGR_SAMPLE_ID=MMETSP1067 /ASSEMBLY_ACC=CAM_ASM_000444 /LENGTH=202 /DNA_ID=CAMNT_0013325525 /DNA_START=17 /DNA_END=625 /DNA_ORIENTATION=-
MSLVSLAVVSRHGTPLYLRDCADPSDLLFDLAGNDQSSVGGGGGGGDDEDLFGDELSPPAPEETTSRQREEWPCRLDRQFALHSACARMEEVLGCGSNRLKAPGASGMDACWVGLLCTSDSLRAYGYVTTNARYVALVEDSIPPENVQYQKSQDNEVCVLMANVHRLHTESLLNPFATPGTKITSRRFEQGVTSLVQDFNGR